MQLSILFESESFVAIDKPAGVLSIPARSPDDPRICIGKVLQEQKGKKIFPVHRLDFEVSGVLLFALTPAAHRVANKWFENHEVKKTYEAWTEVDEGGRQKIYESRTLWESLLVRGKKRAFEADYGKLSKTLAQWTGDTLWNGEPALTWEIQPLTGRSHQLRYELTKHGFPILGDELYGAKIPYMADAIALRAVAIQFPANATSNFGLPNELCANKLPSTMKDQI